MVLVLPDDVPVTLVVLFLLQVNVELGTVDEIVIAVKAVPEQTVWVLFVMLTTGVGFTVTTDVAVALLQVPAVAVTVKVVVCTVTCVLVNVPETGVPVPLAAIPVVLVVLSLVQLKVVPDTLFGLVILIAVMVLPEQIACEAETATVGCGFTVMVAVVEVLLQVPAVATMVNTDCCWVFVTLVNTPEIVVPVPEAAMPVKLVVLVLVHEKVVPETAFGLLITILVIPTPEQTIWELLVALTVGVGFTVTVAVNGAPLQPLIDGVMV